MTIIMGSLSKEEWRGELVYEGKTKIVRKVSGDSDLAILEGKDDITAGDGAKHDIIPNKAVLATATTCNVFSLLKACGVPFAFERRFETDTKSFLAPLCKMFPYEVVFRREAYGSYLKRHPDTAKGFLFPKLLVEFYLKTAGRRFKEHELPCDDPLMKYSEGDDSIDLYHPAKILAGQVPFLRLAAKDVFRDAEEWKDLRLMKEIGRRAFFVLEKAFEREGRTLIDIKFEFGTDTKGELLLADVIDNDSWRVIEDGQHIDKQAYREGGELSDVARKYAHVARLSERLTVPKQRIVIWTGSEKDNIDSIHNTIYELGFESLIQKVTCSIHKEPVRGIEILRQKTHECPDSVFIAFIGMSNGAGPTLAANTTVPVIAIPANYKEFPEDVWSSLRVPSNVPLSTILDPKNAAIAALTMLSVRNPHIYSVLREKLEDRM